MNEHDTDRDRLGPLMGCADEVTRYAPWLIPSLVADATSGYGSAVDGDWLAADHSGHAPSARDKVDAAADLALAATVVQHRYGLDWESFQTGQREAHHLTRIADHKQSRLRWRRRRAARSSRVRLGYFGVNGATPGHITWTRRPWGLRAMKPEAARKALRDRVIIPKRVKRLALAHPCEACGIASAVRSDPSLCRSCAASWMSHGWLSEPEIRTAIGSLRPDGEGGSIFAAGTLKT